MTFTQYTVTYMLFQKWTAVGLAILAFLVFELVRHLVPLRCLTCLDDLCP